MSKLDIIVVIITGLTWISVQHALPSQFKFWGVLTNKHVFNYYI